MALYQTRQMLGYLVPRRWKQIKILNWYELMKCWALCRCECIGRGPGFRGNIVCCFVLDRCILWSRSTEKRAQAYYRYALYMLQAVERNGELIDPIVC